MKGTEHFKRTIQMFLEQRAAEDELFAKSYRNPAKNIDDCVTYILNYVQKSGCNGFSDGEIYGQAIHYYDENEIEVGKPIQCQVAVNHVVELTEEEKQEARRKAVAQYGKEYTLMTGFQLQDNMVELFKRHSYNQLNDTLMPPEEEAVYTPIYNVIDQMPEFPGGMDKLLQFINDNMQYPAKAQTEGIQGRVAVQFIVNEDGYIIEPNIVRSVEPSLDNEALRLIKMLPQWKPGTLKGKAVKVKYTVPVTFRLDKIKEKIPKTSQSATQILRPAPRNIPTGKNVNPDSLSMCTEYARYPLSTTEVKIAVFNHSQQKYTCGNDYSLAFYNNSNQQWEALPTSPAFEDIGWVLLPKYPPHQQTIKLYTSEVPNRPGKYRIYKTFYRDTKEVTYAEFEIFSNLK